MQIAVWRSGPDAQTASDPRASPNGGCSRRRKKPYVIGTTRGASAFMMRHLPALMFPAPDVYHRERCDKGGTGGRPRGFPRSVVGDDEFVRQDRLCRQPGQSPTQILRFVEGADDDRSLHCRTFAAWWEKVADCALSSEATTIAQPRQRVASRRGRSWDMDDPGICGSGSRRTAGR